MHLHRQLTRATGRFPAPVVVAAVLCAMLAGVLPAAAQAAPEPLPDKEVAAQPEPTGTVVLFTLEGRLPEAGGETGLPLALVDRLAADQALARLDVDGRSGAAEHPLVSANFVFQSPAAFRQWYASPQTAALLRDLAAAVVEPRKHLRIVRRPLSGYFPD
jgi:hypothetical protein